MVIKNLSSLKRALQNGHKIRIVEHYYHPECTGQVRVPNVVQSNGVYSVVDGEPDSPVSLANDGRGFWFSYGRASDWEFADGMCIQSIRGNKVWKLEVL